MSIAKNRKDKCVHTEHCCAIHGCKYGHYDCPVETMKKAQSYPCEQCDEDSGNDGYSIYIDRITDLERRNGELEKLLAVAACPMCDGSGAVYGADMAVCCNRPTDAGECCNNPIPEQSMEPCQFCYDRAALTRTKENNNDHRQ